MRPRVAVISHERSGTHFLMNAIAMNFGYLQKPWWNLDYGDVNYHDCRQLKQHLQAGLSVSGMPPEAILKSHHAVEFFEPFMAWFVRQFKVFYIHRDSDSVMRSFHKYCNDLPAAWTEGPRCSCWDEFSDEPPMGACRRYQMGVEWTMYNRHFNHVKRWLDAAERFDICVMKYEELDDVFNTHVLRIAKHLGMPVPDKVQRPDKDSSVIVEAKDCRRVYPISSTSCMGYYE